MNDTLVEVDKQCFRCDQYGTLEPVENHELTNHETDEIEYHNGYLCIICNCFHAEDNSFIEYPIDRELHTTYNVKSWLN
jgi:hypothetical protein